MALSVQSFASGQVARPASPAAANPAALRTIPRASQRDRLTLLALPALARLAEMQAYNQTGNTTSGNVTAKYRLAFRSNDIKLNANLAALEKAIPGFTDAKVKADAKSLLAKYRAEHRHQIWASKLTGMSTGKMSATATPIAARKAALGTAKASFTRAVAAVNAAKADLLKLPIPDPMKTDAVEQASRKLFTANRNIAKALDDIRKAIISDVTMGEIVTTLKPDSRQTLKQVLANIGAPITNTVNTFSSRLAAAVVKAKANNNTVVVKEVDRNGIVTTVSKPLTDPAAVAALGSRLNANLLAFAAANSLTMTTAQVMQSVKNLAASIPALSPDRMLTGVAGYYVKQQARKLDAWSKKTNFNTQITSSANAIQAANAVNTKVRFAIRPGNIASRMEPNKMGQTLILANTVREVMSSLYEQSTSPKSPNPAITIKHNAGRGRSFFIETINLAARDRRMKGFYEMQYRLAHKFPNAPQGGGIDSFKNPYSFKINNYTALRDRGNVIFFKGNSDIKLGNFRYYFNNAAVDIYAKPFSSLKYLPFDFKWKANGNTPNKVSAEEQMAPRKKP